MKTLIMSVAMLLATPTFANTIESVFKKDSTLPVRVQERVLEALKTRCGNLLINYGLKEVVTTETIVKVDQGITDRYYKTELSSRFYFDGMHPSYADITVESVLWDHQNGDDISVQTISSPDRCEVTQK